MTKSDLTDLMASGQSTLSERDVKFAVRAILQQMSDALVSGERIEVRGFGSFTRHSRPYRIRRNPKTGEVVAVPARFVAHFKPGKDLRDPVNGCTTTGILRSYPAHRPSLRSAA